jgi:hypothetical protein
MNKLTLLLFLFAINFGCSQNGSNDLEQTFNKFQKLNENKDYDNAFDYYYEGFLKIVPKSELIKDLSKLNGNPNYEYSVKNSKIISISGIIKQDGIEYALIKFGGKTHITFNDSSDVEMIELIKENAKNIYGDTYSYSESKKEITFSKESEMIAITDNGWKFFAYSEKIKPIIKTLVPSDVLDRIFAKRN